MFDLLFVDHRERGALGDARNMRSLAGLFEPGDSGTAAISRTIWRRLYTGILGVSPSAPPLRKPR